MSHQGRIDLYDDLSEALRDGEPLLQFFQKRRDRAQARGRKKMARLFAVCAERHGDHGIPLSGSLAGAVPASDLMVIKSAEVAGNLADGLQFLGRISEKTLKMRKSIILAIAIPAFDLCLILGILFLFSKMMVPILIDVVPIEKWHPMGQVLFVVSSAVTGYWPVTFALLASAVYGFAWSLPNWTGPLRFQIDRYLPYSIYRDYHGGIFLVTLAALLRAGTSIGDALDMLRDIGTVWMRRHLAIMRSRIDQGVDPVHALNTGVVHEDIAYRVIDYGERSGFQKGVEKIGLKAVEIITEKITNSATLINVVATIMVGLILGFVILSFLLTTQSVDQTMTGV